MKKYKCFLFILILPLVFIGCSNHFEQQSYRPVIIDEAQMLNQQTVRALANYPYPKGFAFIIHTVKKLPPKEVGSMVDAAFDEDVKKCPEENACKQRGVYIVVSQEPALIQVRAGSDFVAQARWAGITVGPKYIEKQLPATSGDFDKALSEMVEWLSSSLPQATNISWIRSWILSDVTQSLSRELGHLSLPSDGFYGNYVLKPFLQSRVLEARFTGTWWLTYLIAAVVIFVFGKLVKLTVNFAIGETNPQVANGMNSIIAILLKLGLAIPSAASAILMSGSRLEDQIALRASGISGIESYSFSTESLIVETGVLLALLLLVLRVVKGFADTSEFIALASLPSERQRQLFAVMKEKNPAFAWFAKAYATTEGGETIEGGTSSEQEFEDAPYIALATRPIFDNFKAATRWGLFSWLFLPKALTLITICFWIVPIMKGLISYIRIRIRLANG